MALGMFEKHNQVQAQGATWLYRALKALLRGRTSPPAPSPDASLRSASGEGENAPGSPSPETALPFRERGLGGEALTAARRALELADEDARTDYPVERDYVDAHWLLGAAHRVNGNIEEAERHLIESLTRCRNINMVDHEADILIDLARLRRAADEPEAAERLAQEALEITERCGYVLQGADAHLELAKLALAKGDKATALEHARAARQLAACDGEPYVYRVAYDEAGALLAAADG